MARFGFLFSHCPHTGEYFETLYNLAKAALQREHEVFIYIRSEGVFCLMNNQKPYSNSKDSHKMIAELLKAGASIITNADDLKIRGIESSKSFADGVKIGSLPDIAEELSKVDRLITL